MDISSSNGNNNIDQSGTVAANKSKNSCAERLAEAEEALAIAKRAVQVAAAAVAAATAAPTYSLEEVEATITAVATATATAAAATAEREAAKVAVVAQDNQRKTEAKNAPRAVREAAKKERKEGEKAEKIISAIASEYREIQAVLERVEEKKRPLAASTMREHKRLKKESDRIRDITPNWIEKDPVMHELHQEIQAEASEREQRVAKTKNEKNKSEKIVAMKMKKWLDSGAVRDVAPSRRNGRNWKNRPEYKE